MGFLCSGTVTGSNMHSGYNMMKYQPFGGNLIFRRPFADVWKVQQPMLETLKV